MNTQIIEHRVKSEGSVLSLHSIFRTVQGEGPFSGRRAVFIRLAGCNLACPQCDTDYTSNRWEESAAAIAELITFGYDKRWLVVITGGEPFRQNIEPLVRELVGRGRTVQIETNGVLPLPSIGFPELCSKDPGMKNKCFVVCSPKTNKVHSSIEAVACAYKYVLGADCIADDGLPTIVLGNMSSGNVARPLPGVPVYVQPADEKDGLRNQENLSACINSALEYGYTIQTQLHKTLGVT